MELKDLIGKHRLSGVDMNNESIESYMNSFVDAEVLRIVLDRKTYMAVEDPDDGYRSCMKEINVSKDKVINKFPPITVVGIMRREGNYEVNDVLELYDINTGKIVISVGTGNTDDYYPYFVAEYHPENMIHNKGE